MNLNINFYKFFDFTALGQAVILSSLSFLTIYNQLYKDIEFIV
jgi:hypothetical protein